MGNSVWVEHKIGGRSQNEIRLERQDGAKMEVLEGHISSFPAGIVSIFLLILPVASTVWDT